MKEFDITITETLKRTVTVQAENADEAMDLVHDQHSQGIHVLDAEDFDDMTIETVGTRELTKLKALLIEPMKPPVEIEIPDTLEALQKAVSGYIEAIPYFDDSATIICNEEGKLQGLPLNRAIYTADNEILDVITGTFLIVKEGEENFESLTPEMSEKYKKLFEKPEQFFKLAGKIVAQKIDLSKEKIVKPKENER